MADQDRVAALGVQRSVGLVDEPKAVQRHAALQLEALGVVERLSGDEANGI